jgi:predicted PurR-regulated permease PerM
VFLRDVYANKWVKLALLAAGVAAAVLLVARLQSILSALLLAFGLAYLCDPLVDLVQRLRVSRAAAVGVVAFLLVGVLLLFFGVIVPLFAHEMGKLVARLPESLAQLQAALLPPARRLLGRIGVAVPDSVQGWVRIADTQRDVLQSLSARLAEPVTAAVRSALSSLVSTLLGLLTVVIVPVVWFYLVRDFDTIVARVAELIPERSRPRVADVARRADAVVRNFLKGQIAVAVLLGLIYAVGLQFVARVPLGFLLGLIAGALSVVPYMGLILGIIPALLLAFSAHGDGLHPLLVVVVFVVAQLLEGNLITPKIVGEKVGMHPVTVIFSLLIFGELFGFVGLLLAVPVTAVGMVFLRDAIEAYKASAAYRGVAKPPTE